jgi:hypothetical protein
VKWSAIAWAIFLGGGGATLAYLYAVPVYRESPWNWGVAAGALWGGIGGAGIGAIMGLVFASKTLNKK